MTQVIKQAHAYTGTESKLAAVASYPAYKDLSKTLDIV